MSTINIPSIDSLRPELNKIKAIQALYAIVKELADKIDGESSSEITEEQ